MSLSPRSNPALPPEVPPRQAAVPSRAGSAARLDSRTLFAGRSELLITHGQEEYHLRITRQGKLILTK